MSISDRLDEIQRRSDDATEGPWWGIMISGRCEVFAGTGSGSDPMLATGMRPGDAEFVVFARTDVPWLIEQVRHLIRERDEWKARAEAAEARTAPAVDRDLVEAAIAEGLHRGLTVDLLARSVCAAINGKPAPDPVEELAGEIDGAVRDAVRKGFDFIDSVTGIEVDQKVVDAMLTWLPSESRALARRAFGQEARDGVDR